MCSPRFVAAPHGGAGPARKQITIIATGSIKISHKPFIKADHPDGILLLAGGDLDLQGDWGGEGLVYGGSQCYVSSRPGIQGSLVEEQAEPARLDQSYQPEPDQR